MSLTSFESIRSAVKAIRSSIKAETLEKELKSYSKWLADFCSGDCANCYLYSPDEDVKCKGTQEAQRLEEELEKELERFA